MPPPTRTAVVICCFTPQRLDDVRAARASLSHQTTPPALVIVVVDHHDDLFAVLRAELEDDTLVVRNSGRQGLSDARNTGLRAAAGADIVLFLDDDAVAETTWVERMTAPFAASDVVGVSGFAVPVWDAPGRPGWFPDEFLWVVGCSHRGLPGDGGAVRNPVGCAMAFRAEALARAGGFITELGRVGSSTAGCEETEVSLRLTAQESGSVIVLARSARVHHRVTAHRQRLAYFLRRCRGEGRSKAAVSRRHPGAATLRTERRFVVMTLLDATIRALGEGLLHLRPAAFARAGVIVIGLAATVVGYLDARIRPERRPLTAPPAMSHVHRYEAGAAG
ncbi:GT2 family glycosyltransferase [Microbacterium sp. SLBN-154]|uniref:glycosyltransferase family 2 protein n=1 Tax=Microbacterium sp. SLBN-154 TaxID=2768458 RepID=UPI00114F8C97|nr:glycosyltransferase [Microbacterium sp. SLBN-154]TQK18710.1 GT2 family glycosyltransferase [Microbacterium sp. SLBN-154]